MSTLIRPELSETNRYWIEKHRYYELKHFCLQYPLWRHAYNSLIDQLDLILYDMYRMDAWLPPLFGKWAEDYKKASYSQWAVDELRDFIDEQIYPRREGSIDEFCKLTHEFMMKTAKYAMVNPNTSLMFRSASEMAANILDLLRAME